MEKLTKANVPEKSNVLVSQADISSQWDDCRGEAVLH
jgi:hypothetical protein